MKTIPNLAILLILFIFFTSNINSQSAWVQQNQWQRVIGGTIIDEAYSVAGTNDGGCICAGTTRSFGAGNQDAYIVKFDAAGSLQWTKTFGGPLTDGVQSITETSDNGYLLLAFLNNAGTNILKLNSSGELQWSKNITIVYAYNSIISTSDGGFAVGGFAWNTMFDDFCIVKLNSSGVIQWNRAIMGDSLENCQSIIQTSDGGYALAGFTKSFGAGLEDIYVVKLDSSGGFQWNCTVGGANSDLASSIIQTADGGYLAVGTTNSYGGGGWHRYIVKLNPNGTLQWTRTVSGAAYMQVPVIQTGDGGFVVSGEYNSDMSIVKFSSAGDLLWNKTIGGSGLENAFSVAKALDGGYFLAGYSESFNGNVRNFYVVKLDSNWQTCGYMNTASSPISSGGIWANPSSTPYIASLVISDIFPSSSSGGTVIPVCTYNPQTYSVSGTVRYQDNNQPVSSGYVKAVRFDTATYSIITVDSAQIQSNGTYTLSNCPPITIDIMAYENDEEELSFVATYYVSTIYWQNATHVKPDSNLTNINIGVYRIVNSGANRNISGYIYRGTSMVYDFVKDARVYAKLDGYYKGYSVSTINGFYQIDSLANGTYEVIVDRMGYYPSTQFAYVNGGNITNFNFTLMAVLNAEKTGSSIPSEYSLYQNYPNPFNPHTEIHFALPKESLVKMVVFDLLGREVAILADSRYKPGEYKVIWDASRFSSGIYFCRLEAGDFTDSKKMVIVK